MWVPSGGSGAAAANEKARLRGKGAAGEGNWPRAMTCEHERPRFKGRTVAWAVRPSVSEEACVWLCLVLI